MRQLVCAVLLCAAPLAIAGDEMIYQGDGAAVILSREDCRVPELAEALTGAGAPSAHTARIVIGAAEIPGCWGLADGDKVLIGDVLGNAGWIPVTQFKPKPAI